MPRSDTEVIKRVQKGDPLAWGQLVKQHTGRVFNLCYRFIGRSDQAEELTRETFVTVFKHLSAHRPIQRDLVSWMVGITRNVIVSQYRKSREIHPSAPSSPCQDKSLQNQSLVHSAHLVPDAAKERIQNSVQLYRGLQQLSPDLREAVILKDLEKLSCGEIGVILNIPDGTVKSRINRGRLELAKSLRNRPMHSQNALA